MSVILFTGIPESFRSLKIKEDGGGLKFSIEMDEQQHEQWSELSKLKGKLVAWTAQVGE